PALRKSSIAWETKRRLGRRMLFPAPLEQDSTTRGPESPVTVWHTTPDSRRHQPSRNAVRFARQLRFRPVGDARIAAHQTATEYICVLRSIPPSIQSPTI